MKNIEYMWIANAFGCPCDYPYIDNIMENCEQCKDCSVDIENWECWKRYFDYERQRMEERFGLK